MRSFWLVSAEKVFDSMEKRSGRGDVGVIRVPVGKDAGVVVLELKIYIENLNLNE